jgi:hypothetical protein
MKGFRSCSTSRAPIGAGVRSQALFWLGQSGDPLAIDLFESVLRALKRAGVPPQARDWTFMPL